MALEFVAIVLELAPGEVGEPGAGESLASEGKLLGGQREALQAQPGASCPFGETAPAAADLEDPRARWQRQLVEDALVLGILRLRERQPGVAAEQRAGVGHRVIEPQPVEGIAQVVVGMDVATRACPAVASQQVAKPVDEARQPVAEDRLVKGAAVG